MTVTIEFHENIKDETIASYSQKWMDSFNMPTETGRHLGGSHGVSDTVWGQSKQYSSINSASTGDYTGIIISGDLHFQLCHVTSYGKIENMEFGTGGLVKHEYHEKALTKHLIDPQLKINDLNIIGEYDNFKLTAENQENVVHQLMSSLNNNNATVDKLLLEILTAQGIDVNTPLKDMAIASQFEVIADTPIIEAVGATDEGGILLAA